MCCVRRRSFSQGVYIFLKQERTRDGTLSRQVNHKRVHRIYQGKGLAMRRKRRKLFRAETRVPLVLRTRAKQM